MSIFFLFFGDILFFLFFGKNICKKEKIIHSEKIRKIRAEFPEKDIQIDGGVNAETISEILKAGANWIVSGSYFWQSADLGEAARVLRGK